MATLAAQPRPPLVGREGALQKLTEILGRGAKTITLVGPPGVGKTRLAEETVARAQPVFGLSPQRMVFCALAGTNNPEEVFSRVADGVSFPPELRSKQEPLQGLSQWIASGSRIGLVLDNAEHATKAVHDMVAAISKGSPEVPILVTSRVPLAHPGEVVLPVRPLETGGDELGWRNDAARLFLLFAGIEPTALSPAEAASVGNIAARLEGLPLSLELAARRLNVLSFAELDAHLDDRFRTLRDNSHLDVPPPYHNALWLTLEWSWALLTEWQRDVLGQCAVFRGSFTAPMVEEVVRLQGPGPPAPPVVDALANLVRSSLVVESGQPGAERFRLLETVRDFARLRWSPDDIIESALYGRYWQAVVGEAETLDPQVTTTRGPAAIARLSELRADLWSIIVAAAPDPVASPELRGRACYGHSEYLMNRGERAHHIKLLDTALDALGDADADPVLGPLIGRLLWRRAGVFRMLNQHEDGVTDGRRAVALAELHGDLWLEAAANSTLMSQLTLGKRAAEFLPEVKTREARIETLNQSVPDTDRFMSAVCSARGIRALRASDLDGAETWFVAGVDHAERGGDQIRKAGLLANVANAKQGRGELDAANADLERALEIYHLHGSLRPALVSRGILAINLFNQGDTSGDMFQTLVDGFNQVGDGRYAAYYLHQRGLTEAEAGNLTAARTTFEEVVGVLEPFNDPYYLPIAQSVLAALDGLEHGAATGRATLEAARATGERVNAWNPAQEWARKMDVVLDGVEHPADPALTSRMHALCDDEGHLGDGAARVAQRLLSLAVSPRLEWRFAATGEWFEPPSGGRVDLSRRKAPKRILAALVAARLASPGVGLLRGAVFEAGWPGESAGDKTVANRVYVAIATLRKLGLDAVLVSDGGYALDAAAHVVVDAGEDVDVDVEGVGETAPGRATGVARPGRW